MTQQDMRLRGRGSLTTVRKTGNFSSQANTRDLSPPINSPAEQIFFLQRTVGRVVCVKFSKREITYELGKGLGLFTNAGGEVAAARAPKGKSSGADAKSEQPVCA
jgi:hypothetical protein